MLPKDGIGDRRLEYDAMSWLVDWDFDGGMCQTVETELIDALFAMIVKLKEKKAI